MRSGADVELPRDRETGKSTHTLLPVYREMLLQICRDYRSLPDVREFTLAQIRFFYDGERNTLREMTRPRK